MSLLPQLYTLHQDFILQATMQNKHQALVLLNDNGEEDDEVLVAVNKWEVVPLRVGRAHTLT